uniref:transporter associated domain-containing protein n=1 Tax=Limnobacter sp. TaxID=2003368 RepID=UPI003517BE98
LNLRALLRPAVFVPESKGLNDLLRQFRDNRNHLAIVIDEFGRTAGLITIEDVLEQIVGEIEDEYDFDEQADHIIGLEGQDSGVYRVKAITELEQFNTAFGTDFSNGHSETIGGLLSDHLGRVPRRGERIVLAPMRFDVVRADARKIHVLKVRRLTDHELEALRAQEDGTGVAGS